jgi:hypothetical protein
LAHFTFVDGALGYDCVRCGARCCHGYGFALPTSELVQLIGRAPALSPFVQIQSNGAHALTFGDGCLVLGDDGRCGVEVAHGRAAKPAVCRLFPLQVFRVRGQLVADLQFRACPLEDARAIAPGPGRTVIRHADLLADLDEPGAAELYPEARLANGAPDDVLDRERQLTEATAALLDAPDPLHATAGDSDRAALASLRAGWRRFFTVDAAESTALEARVARPFLLTLPSLRWHALTALDAPPYPKLMRRLPARLTAAVWLTALAVRSGKPATPRLCADLWHGLPLVRSALARFNEQVELRDTPLPATMPTDLRIAYEVLKVRARDQPLVDALCATSLAPELRPLLLRLVSDRMA